MDIYIDASGLKEYLKQFRNALRIDHNEKNNSLFNFKFDTIFIDRTFRSQDLFLNSSIIIETDDKTIPLAERSVINRKLSVDKKKAIHKELIKDGLFNNESEEFEELFDAWFKEANIDILPKDERSIFQNECSLSLAEGIKYSNNPSSVINRKSIIKKLKEIFIVYKETFNRTIFTPEMKGWDTLCNTLKHDKDIVLIDKYFFGFSDESSYKRCCAFLKDICDKNFGEEKNIVIFYGNKKMKDEDLDKLTNDVNNTKVVCKITYVYVELKTTKDEDGNEYKEQLLHDRLIISNYRLICSGHSFPTYFEIDDQNKKSFTARGGLFITIGSIADRNNEKVMEHILAYLQKEILDYMIEGVCQIYYTRHRKDEDASNRSNLLNLRNIKNEQ